MTIDELMARPWTWFGPFRREEDGHAFYEMRVAELPDFFVAGETEPEVRQESRDALEAYLASLLEHDEVPEHVIGVAPNWRFIQLDDASLAVSGGWSVTQEHVIQGPGRTASEPCPT